MPALFFFLPLAYLVLRRLGFFNEITLNTRTRLSTFFSCVTTEFRKKLGVIKLRAARASREPKLRFAEFRWGVTSVHKAHGLRVVRDTRVVPHTKVVVRVRGACVANNLVHHVDGTNVKVGFTNVGTSRRG